MNFELGKYAVIYTDSYPLSEYFINENFVIYFDIVDGMQSRTQREESLNTKRPLVIRALRRSNVRKKIAEYLFDISPSCSYTSEIAYNIKTTPTNVIGAIRGMGTRYKTDESLIDLGIVEEKVTEKNIKSNNLS